MDPDWKYEPARDLQLRSADRWRSVSREVGLTTTILTGSRWFAVKSYLRIFHSLHVSGTENVPGRFPFVLVANHSSHLDALALASVLPLSLDRQVFPIAAGDHFFETRAAATFASLFMNALPVWRQNCGAHSLDTLRTRLLEEPCSYIVFPEGTRSRNGEMGGFKPGVGKLVAGTSVPVIPCRLSGAHAAFPPDAKLPRPRRITLTVGVPQYFADTENSRAGWNEIARRLESAVRELPDLTVQRRFSPIPGR